MSHLKLRQWNLLIHNVTDMPVNYSNGKVIKGLRFSNWVAGKLNSLFPSLPIRITAEEISVSHPLRLKNKLSKQNVIVVRFVRRDVRNEIFYSKSQLKGTGITISQSAPLSFYYPK